MTHTPVDTSPSIATRIEVRAQSLFLAVMVLAVVGMVWQMLETREKLGGINANVVTLTELAREHGGQLRDLDRRLAGIDTRLEALTEAVNKLVVK